MIVRNFLIIFGCLIAQSCASHKLVINASAPARIEVNGVTVCATTPCSIVNSCSRHGEQTRLEAFPIERSKGFTQTKTVAARCAMGSENLTDVYFDMRSRAGIAVEHFEQ